MATSALQTAYRQEIINGFDKTVSLLYDTVTTEYVDKGGSAVFLVNNTSDSTGAVTRGVNGLIPAKPLSLTQNTATLAPWYSLVTVNDFNMFASQGDLTKPMQRLTMRDINNKIDNTIRDTLDTATVTAGTAQTADVALVTKAMGILGLATVPMDGMNTLLITPAFLAYLMRTPEFTSADYVSSRPMENGGPAWGDTRGYYNWMGLKVIVDPKLTGVGTASEKCYLYNAAAIGYAVNKSSMDFKVGFNEEQLYSWANGTVFMGATKMQNAGIVQILHDGSAIVGS